MKLKTKLFAPILGVGAIAATVIPLTVSCETNGQNTFDGSEVFVPTSEKAVADSSHPDGYDETDGTKLYFSDLAANPQILPDDIKFQTASSLYTGKVFERHRLYAGSSYAETVIEVITGKITLDFADVTVNTTEQTVSFTLRGSSDFETYPIIEEDPYYSGSGYISLDESIKAKLDSFTLKLENVPYHCSVSGGIYGGSSSYVGNWSFVWDLGKFASNVVGDNFKVTLSANGYLAYYNSVVDLNLYQYKGQEVVINKDNIGAFIGYNNNESVTKADQALYRFCKLFTETSNSYHMSEIDYKQYTPDEI